MTTAHVDQRDLEPAEVRELARQFVRDYIAENGREPIGEEVGDKFGMQDRWGRNQISAVRDGVSRGTLRAVPHPGSGTSGTDRHGSGMPPSRSGMPHVPEPARAIIADPTDVRPTVSLTRLVDTGTDSGMPLDHGRHAAGTTGMPPGTERHAGAAEPATWLRRFLSRLPLLLIAASAFVAIWGGWVGLGKLTGFGQIELLPGIVGWKLDTAITLPLGMEAYAAYALRVWLAPPPNLSDFAGKFARASAIAALVLGAAGQIAYHLMVADGMVKAPWWITTFVSCLPVGVLGCAAALAHLVHHSERKDQA